MTDDDSVFYLSEFSNLYCQELINQSKLYLQLNNSLKGLQEIFEHSNSINDLYNYSASSNETTIELLSIAIELNNKESEENETLRETPVAFLYCCDKFWGKVELRGNTSLSTTLKDAPLSKAKLTKGFQKSTLKISFHSDSDDVIANENRFQSSPSDDENSFSNRNSLGENKSNFDSNNYKLETNLGDIKEEDEDYEKDFLMLIGTSDIAFDNKII